MTRIDFILNKVVEKKGVSKPCTAVCSKCHNKKCFKSFTLHIPGGHARVEFKNINTYDDLIDLYIIVKNITKVLLPDTKESILSLITNKIRIIKPSWNPNIEIRNVETNSVIFTTTAMPYMSTSIGVWR